MQKIHVKANIGFRAKIRFTFSHICFKIYVLKQTLSEFHIQANIRLQILTYGTTKYSYANFCILANIRHILLQVR
jgi:hypothetical protein